MIDQDKLTDFDFEILQFVSDHHRVRETSIPALSQPSAALQYRIDVLSTPDRKTYSGSSLSIPISNSSYLNRIYETVTDEYGFSHGNYTGFIEISELGVKALEEWHLANKKASRKLWEERLWKFAPLPISITALAVAIISLLQALHWIQLAK